MCCLPVSFSAYLPLHVHIARLLHVICCRDLLACLNRWLFVTTKKKRNEPECVCASHVPCGALFFSARVFKHFIRLLPCPPPSPQPHTGPHVGDCANAVSDHVQRIERAA